MSPKLVILATALAAAAVASGCGSPQKTANPSAPPTVHTSVTAQAPAAAVQTSDQAPAVTGPLNVGFDAGLKLVGISAPATARRGEPVEVEYVWQVLKKPAYDYIVAVHIDRMDAKPFFRVNRDHMPSLPTSKWQVGKFFSWKQQVVFPADAPAGTYSITVYPYWRIPTSQPKKYEISPVLTHPGAEFVKIRLEQ